ncbi:MAG: peptide transporter, partial [Campylobacterota bacterium]
MLTNPQETAAKMARLDVEYTEKNFESNRSFSNIGQMTIDYGFDDSNDFLLSLQTDMKMPKKTRDIYFYLPFRMLNIYPTVNLFSNLNLMSGVKNKAPFFFVSRNFKDLGESVALGSNISLNKKDLSITVGKNRVPVRRFVKTAYDNEMRLQKSVQLVDFSSNLSLIFMSSYNTFLIVDEKTYNSLYVQLMILEEYDKNLFEKVIVNPHAKVYKLKI